MVYIHIPENLTEEEQMLMAKYAKLKKKVRKSKNIKIPLIKLIFLEKASSSIKNKTRARKAINSKTSQ